MKWFDRLPEIIVRKSVRSIVVCGVTALLTCSVFANPVINNVAAGNVSIQQTSSTTTVDQTSQKAIINWQSFNIGAGQSTHFQQPVGGVALNRISPTQGASQIYGVLTATGQIILINPAGVYFGPSAYVNVGGMIATTENMSNENFMNNIYQFSKVGAYSGAVVNDGQLIAAQNGLVALVAPGVVNNGIIQANLGHVILASGNAFTVGFSDDDVNFAINVKTSSPGIDKNGNVLTAGVTNTGSLIANGGTILLTAQAVAGILDEMIDMQGVAQAKSVYQQNGTIILSGDPDSGVVNVAANLDASGKGTGQTGGNVDITGYDILLNSPTLIDVSGNAGGGNIYIGGNAHGAGPLPNANAVVMMPGVNLLADAITTGNGGNVVLWSDYYTQAYGNISAEGGALSGDGGYVETSAPNLDVYGVTVNTLAANGTTGMWLLDPYDVTINDTTTTDMDTGTNIYTPTASGAIVSAAALGTALDTSSITISTANASGTEDGDITFADSSGELHTNWTTGANTLTLLADNNIAINNAITLDSGQTLTLTAGNTTTTGSITMNAGIAGATAGSGTVNMTAGSAGTITINDALGATALSSLTINSNGTSTTALNGNVTTANSQIYGTPVTLGADTTVTSTGNTTNITFNSTINGAYAFTASLGGAGTLTIDGAVGGITPLTSVTATTGSPIFHLNGGSITTTGAQTFTANIILGADTILTAGGNITFNPSSGSLGGDYALTLSSPETIDINSTVATLSSITTGGGGTTLLEGGAITTSGANGQDYGEAVTLHQETSLNAGSAPITFASTIDSLTTVEEALALTTTGTITIGGAIGSKFPIASLTTGTGSTTVINGGTVTTAGSGGQVYNGAVTLGAATTLNANTGPITFVSTIDSSTSAVALALNSTGTITLGGVIGGAKPLASLTTNGSSTAIDANVTTTGDQTYNDSITPGAATTTLTATGASSVITLGAGADWSSTDNLSLNASGSSGTIVLDGPVTAASGTLTLSASNTSQSITTGASGAVDVANFSLLQGQWYQVNETLPAFSATANFLLNNGTIPNAKVQFIRALSGNGTTAPYIIADVYGLQGIDSNPTTLGYNYELANNINASVTSGWNSGAGFIPIGNSTTTFTGTFNGEGYIIDGLTIYLPDTSYVGLFGDNNGTIQNVGLTNLAVSANYYAGGLIGYNNGTVANAYTTGSVSAGYNHSNSYVGGLIGVNNAATISNVSSSATVTGNIYTGGLIGYNLANLTNAMGTVYSDGTVSGTTYTGGLIGYNTGNITGSADTIYSAGTVSGTSEVGGLIGVNTGAITGASATIYSAATVNGTSTYVGGVVGNSSGAISDVYNTGNVTASGYYVGGIVGRTTEAVTDVYNTGDITGAYYVGGIAGQLVNATATNYDLDSAYNTGTIMATTSGDTGGLVGYLDATSTGSDTITNSYNTGNVSANGTIVGGIAGYSNQNISDVHNTGAITGDYYVGGIVGELVNGSANDYNINNAYNTGTITSTTSGDTGGLAGLLEATSSGSNTVTNFNNTGTIAGGIYSGIGGIAGVVDNTGSSTITITSSNNSGAITGGSYVGGLVGELARSGTTSTNTISDSYNTGVVTGTNTGTGGLIGYVAATTMGDTSISNDYNTGTVSGKEETGGLIGIINTNDNGTNSVSDSDSTGSVTATSSYTGGLIGYMDATTSLNTVYSTGSVTGASYTGGLVGYDAGSIQSVYSTGKVTGVSYTGGLVGYDVSGSIQNAYSTGSVTATSSYLGGLIGSMAAAASVSDVYSTGNVNGMNTAAYTGGLVGYDAGSIQNAYSTGNVSEGYEYTGGLIGYTATTAVLNDVHSTGNVSGVSPVGGLIGENYANFDGIADGPIYSTGTVQGTPYDTGGLIGTNYGNISNLSVSMPTVSGDLSVGGLAGTNYGTISDSSSSTNVTGGAEIGSLVGWNFGTIINSYSTGTATGSGQTGGLVGMNAGTISNSFSTGAVYDTGYDAGGLVGENQSGGVITQSYSLSPIISSAVDSTGGLVGINDSGATVTDSYWNTETSGYNSSAGGTGLTTAQMMTQSSFSGWDFTDTWSIIEGQSYPYLQAFYAATPRVVSGSTSSGEGTAIALAVSGNSDTVYTGANGAYYFLEGDNLVSGINSTITDNTPLLLYFNGDSIVGNTVTLAPAGGGSITGAAITANTLTIGNSLYTTISNADLATAVGSLSSSNILYSASGDNITLGNSTNKNVTFSTTPTTTYTLNGNIAPISGATSSSVTFNGPVTANSNVSLIATAISFLDSLTGTGNISVTGANSNNTLTMQTGNTEIFGITSANAGTVTGMSGYTGALNFNNVQNLTGGNSGNTFNFANNATLGGTVDGANIGSTNTININAYTAAINIILSSTNNGVINNMANSLITAFKNITNINANNTYSNSIQMPSGQASNIYITGGNVGYINDPIFFNGINTFIGTSGSSVSFLTNATYDPATNLYYIDGVGMSFASFASYNGYTVSSPTISVSNVVQQPPTNANQNATAPVTSSPTWVLAGTTVDQNITTITTDVSNQIDNNLKTVKINPYCYTAQ